MAIELIRTVAGASRVGRIRVSFNSTSAGRFGPRVIVYTKETGRESGTSRFDGTAYGFEEYDKWQGESANPLELVRRILDHVLLRKKDNEKRRAQIVWEDRSSEVLARHAADSAPNSDKAGRSLVAERKPMKINRFFTEILGANLRNPRWSWGAFDPIANRVYLRVWDSEIVQVESQERILVANDNPRRQSPGFGERQEHVAQIRNGAEAFGVLCSPEDPEMHEVPTIKDFDRSTLLRLGDLHKEGHKTYATIAGRVPVEELGRQRTGQSTLAEDLRRLARQGESKTTKEALISARVGQGIFRSQVLGLWSDRCAVTGSAILDVVRASHIKPWRCSTNEERLDPHNGLPLVASLDALFDAGLISFQASGEMIVSQLMSEQERKIFSLRDRSLSRSPGHETARYLEFHRGHVFRE